MKFNLNFKNTFLIIAGTTILVLTSCKTKQPMVATKETPKTIQPAIISSEIIVGANNIDTYLPLLKEKRVGIVSNQTSVIFKPTGMIHLVDSLIKKDIQIAKVFSPEHGFRGVVDAAEDIDNSIDSKTGIAIVSLYGTHKKPTTTDLSDVDVMVFDIQDIGVRYYTYISTLHYVMEACAENNKPLIVLDRPNPNAHYIDGPMLNPTYSSFVGKHPVPLVYGLTIGEYATMINGEKWLSNQIQCDLTVIKLKNYKHNKAYHLPVRPSPNLPNDLAIQLYPSLGFFEGTPINEGRGTEFQFQRYGAPDFPISEFSYTPAPNFGSKNPKHIGKLCYGVDLSKEKYPNKVTIKWLLDAYNKTTDKEKFFGNTFTIHAGDVTLKEQITKGMSARDIEESWQPAIEEFKKIRSKYLIYH